MSDYGIKEYKEILENAFEKTKNDMEFPFGMSYEDGQVWRTAQQSAYLHALEMIPEDA